MRHHHHYPNLSRHQQPPKPASVIMTVAHSAVGCCSSHTCCRSFCSRIPSDVLRELGTVSAEVGGSSPRLCADQYVYTHECVCAHLSICVLCLFIYPFTML
eukprot:GHVQ01011547.1.p1 GENE.GHVQ01011547.1~~GHVQ01011547.1.p1  ORF type:complete len:101 (+),score=10.89 GHVQ01011547.1:272-574(+)